MVYVLFDLSTLLKDYVSLIAGVAFFFLPSPFEKED